MQNAEEPRPQTFGADSQWNRRIFPEFDREYFPFYFNYIEYTTRTSRRKAVRLIDPTYRSVYVRIKYHKPIHPFCTFHTNRLWKEHLVSLKIVS